jgi:opacity protein-like surface antigen
MKNFKINFGIYFIVSVFVLSNINTANAQDDTSIKRGEFGIRLMPTFTSFKLNSSSGGSVNTDVVVGFGAGALLGFNFSNHVGVQGELIYSSIIQKADSKNNGTKVNLRYVNVPLLLSLNTGKNKMINLNIVAGPQLGFNVGSSLSTSGSENVNDPQPVLSVKKSDFGFAYGAGVDFGLNSARSIRLSLGYRGVAGLLDVSDKNKNNTSNSYYVLDRTHINTNAGYVGFSILF